MKSTDWNWSEIYLSFIVCALGLCLVTGVLIVAITWFQTTQTGACAQQGGTSSFETDYVQCANGDRVVYRKADVYAGRYEVKVHP